jgi:hypothetical protein
MTLKPRFLVAFGAFFIIATNAVMLTAAVASATPDPNWASIKINEVSSDNTATPLGDAVELYNTGSVAVDINGWRQTDSTHPVTTTSSFLFAAKLPDGTATTTIPANGYVYFASTQGLGSGGDAVKVYLPDLTPVDSVTYGGGEAGTDETNNFGALAYARCPNGTGSFASVGVKSFGASNATACNFQKTNPHAGGSGGSDLPGTCTPEAPDPAGAVPAGAVPWPGSTAPVVADNLCAFETATGPEGRDISGLVFDKTDPSILWAVKNKSWIFKLVKNAGGTYDAAPGWTGGKEIYFPGAVGQPDSEGITQGPDGMLYTTTERDNGASSTALDTVLQFDPNAATLTAAKEWNLTADFVGAGRELNPTGDQNLGFEGLTYVPDSYLTANGFVDQHTGATYNPASYPLHGSGLFFLALEKNGHLYAYALNSDGTFQRVADIATGMAGVMDVAYDPDLGRIWTLCDNTCGVTSTLLKIGVGGAFVADKVFARPAGLPNNNIEGFAVAPESTSTDGLTREVVWSDDGIYGTGLGSTTEGHALYRGSLYLDIIPPTLVLPATITVNATGPAGATVGYTASASDNAGGSGLASSSCTPASGSLFPIGTTTVNCTATDNVGNSSSGSFTVHIRSASEQVSVLLTAVDGVGPGSALTNKLTKVRGYIATNNKAQACNGLSGFLGLVAAQKGKTLTVAQADSFTAQANGIRATLDC